MEEEEHESREMNQVIEIALHAVEDFFKNFVGLKIAQNAYC